MVNGLYDFILAHYNPSQTGAGVNTTLKECIDAMSFSYQGGNHFTFNGIVAPLPNLPPRVVNLGSSVTLNSDSRKTGAGAINNVFYGSITAAMADYLVGKLGLQEFRNANIYGPASQMAVGIISYRNAGFVDSNGSIGGNFYGLIDFSSSTGNIANVDSGRNAKLVLHKNPASSMGFHGFKVVDAGRLTGSYNKVGSEQLGLGVSYIAPEQILFPSKSAATNFGAVLLNVNYPPKLRLYPDGGVIKYAPNDGVNNVSSTNISGNILRHEDSYWEAYGDAGTAVPTRTWAAIPATEKFSASGSIARSPGGSGVRLAGSMPVWPAVLPSAGTGSRKRERAG
jgi:hypothetical protein